MKREQSTYGSILVINVLSQVLKVLMDHTIKHLLMDDHLKICLIQV
jgi:hypothetical protein